MLAGTARSPQCWREGNGSRMSPRSHAAAPPPRHGSGARRRPPLVLVADDVCEQRGLLVKLLRPAGLRAAEAGDGREAIEKARSLRPDLIVMDLSMPVIDGWEATRRLKADPDTRRIPIVILTGCGLLDQSRAFEVGCDAYLLKPCSAQDLIGVVRMLLDATEDAATG